MSLSVAWKRRGKYCKSRILQWKMTRIAAAPDGRTQQSVPLKFLMTSFFAAPGFVFARGDACLLMPLPDRAEKFAFFWGSVIVAQDSDSSSSLFLLSVRLRLEVKAASPLFSSDRARLFAFKRGMHYYFGLFTGPKQQRKDVICLQWSIFPWTSEKKCQNGGDPVFLIVTEGR